MSEDSIEFSLSIAEQRAVGFIPAWSLAFLYSFPFILNLLHRRECGKVPYHKCHTFSHSHMTSHNGSHDRCGKMVHRPYSSCIRSIENLTGTLLGFLYQLLNKEQLA